MNTIEIKTRDGICPSYVFRPSGTGPWPAILMYMDGIGIRPACFEVAAEIATHGYLVLLPDLFYRSGPYEPMDAKTVFSDPEKRKTLNEKFFSLATVPNVMSDTRAFLDTLATLPDAKSGPVGTTGYCFGGPMSLSAAGLYPDRIAASASYHGGRLATDAPESPHLLAPKMKARIYVAGAVEDPTFPDDMKVRLADALTKAGVAHQIETYPSMHGWVFSDTISYDAASSKRHMQTLVALMDQTIKAA